MKYRRLSLEELKELEKEFINFLSMNSIPAEDWERMKTTNPDKVNEYIDTFSDMVLEKALQNIQFLELRSPSNVMYFNCQKEAMTVFSLVAKPGLNLSLTDEKTINDIAEGTISIANGDFSISKFEKDYSKSREEEVFDLTSQGALITNDAMVNLLEELNK